MLRPWIKAGHVILTPGPSTEFSAIRDKIIALGKEFKIEEIAVDPWNARQLASELITEGFEVFEFQQSMRAFTEPTKAFEVAVKARKLRHGGHPVLRWMMSNVMVQTDASGNYRPSKKHSAEKIDGIVATIMGFARMTERMSQPVVSTASVYETRDPIFIDWRDDD